MNGHFRVYSRAIGHSGNGPSAHTGGPPRTIPPKEYTMTHSRIGKHAAAIALAACCACTALPAAADSHYTPDWAAIVSQAAIPLEQAISQAVAASGGQAIEAEFKRGKWSQSPAWEIELITADGRKVEMRINAASGHISQQRSKPAKYQYTERLNAASLTLEQAIAQASEHAPGQAIGAELESRWGSVVFEVKVLRADGVVQKVLINAQDGGIQPLLPPLAVSLPQAIALALQAAPGQALEAELESDKTSTAPFYAVEILTTGGLKSEIRVDANSGQTALHKSKPAKDKYRNRLNAAALSLEQAIAAASAHTAGQVLAAELDSHWGRSSYEVKILREDGAVQKLAIDAADGAVLRARWAD